MADVDHQQQRRKLPNKKFVALLYVPLMIPGIIPLYHATQQDDPAVALVMAATGVGVLIFNAVLLVALYRWFARMGEDR
jgi:hypothetical protein